MPRRQLTDRRAIALRVLVWMVRLSYFALPLLAVWYRGWLVGVLTALACATTYVAIESVCGKMLVREPDD